jgi:hypothetical protein
VSSSQEVLVHWVGGGERQTSAVPMQFPRPSQVSPVVQFLPSLHGVLAGIGMDLVQSPAAVTTPRPCFTGCNGIELMWWDRARFGSA